MLERIRTSGLQSKSRTVKKLLFPELTFDLTAAALAGYPFFIGESAGQLAVQSENRGDPLKVDLLLAAVLMGTVWIMAALAATST